MDYLEFLNFTQKYNRPVILIEGTRTLPDSDRPKLIKLGKKLAIDLPTAIFRTGNAKGSDEAFAEGVQQIDPNRLEYVLPYQNHRKDKIPKQSFRLSLPDILEIAKEQAIYITINSSPSYSSLLALQDKNPRLKAKARYILRDTIKVTGAIGSSLMPATVGIFYVNADDPMKGGTGHTIRVCKKLSIPVIMQDEWMTWIN